MVRLGGERMLWLASHFTFSDLQITMQIGEGIGYGRTLFAL